MRTALRRQRSHLMDDQAAFAGTVEAVEAVAAIWLFSFVPWPRHLPARLDPSVAWPAVHTRIWWLVPTLDNADV